MYNVLFLLPFVAQALEMMNLLVSVNTQHIDLQTLMLLKLHRPASTWNKLLLISFYLLVKHFFASKTLLYDGILASTSIIAYIWLRLCALFHVLFKLTYIYTSRTVYSIIALKDLWWCSMSTTPRLLQWVSQGLGRWVLFFPVQVGR